jgi:hypothetical protein
VVRSDGAPGGYARGRQKKVALLRRDGVKFIAARKVATATTTTTKHNH